MAGEPRRAVFFDRDGTLMEEVEYCRDPARVRVFPGAAEGLARLRAAGWLNVIITNQSGIGRGYFSVAEYEAVQAEVERQLGGTVDGTYFCADHPDVPSSRRKPGTGMVEEAARDLNINAARSWFVGDKAIDIACGRAAGCRTILVRTGYGDQQGDCGADFTVGDAREAVDVVLGRPWVALASGRTLG